MFDGNHRSRKEVDLSGRTRRRAVTTSSNNKHSVLEQSRRLREDRRLQQLKHLSSICIQKVWRGFSSRWNIQRRLMATATATSPLDMSIVLSDPILRAHGGIICSSAIRDKLLTLRFSEMTKASEVTFQRIVAATLGELKLLATVANNYRDSYLLLQLLHQCFQGTRLSYSLYRLLVLAWRAWADHAPDSIISLSLWEACTTFVNELSSPLLTASMLLLVHPENFLTCAKAVMFDSSLDSMMAVIHSEMENMTNDSPVKDLLTGGELTVLTNALNWYLSLSQAKKYPHSILYLLEYMLTQRNDLTWLLALQVKGENIRDYFYGSQVTPVGATTNDDDSISSTDSGDDDVEMTDSNNKKQKSARLPTSEVHTIPKLDRLYQNYIQSQRKSVLVLPNDPKSIIFLVEELTKPVVWLDFGSCALSERASEKTRLVYVRLLATLLQACCSFKTSTACPLLSQLAFHESLLNNVWRHILVLMHNSNAVNNRPSEESSITLALTVFCDLFAQHLITLSDSIFLNTYTTLNYNPVIIAEYVITTIRNVLHDLYWQRPVVADDIPSNRVRLLLSGTKLWNSLYERWCRLVRVSPFCEESTWWFPRLASRHDDDDAVKSPRVNDVSMMRGITTNDDDALAETFRDAKMARVLTSIPQALPFERRVNLFHALLEAEHMTTQDETADFRRALIRMAEQGGEMLEFNGRERISIHRDMLYEDSMKQLNQLGQRLKGRVQVTFINQHGAQEAGIDGGGVFKEFLDHLIKEAFDPNAEHEMHLFTITPLQTLAVNMETVDQKEILTHYEFLGRVLGKAVYESILVEPQFCLPFLNQLLGKQNSLEDLKNLDEEFYSNLMKLRSMSETDIKNLGLTFELQLGPSRLIPLLPGGASLAVTNLNVIHYVHLVAHYRLNVVTASQTRAFLRGFRDLIPASWVRMFSAHELQKLVSGDDTIRGIDVASLKQAMQYAGGYHPSQEIIGWFWEVVDELTPEQQRKFLKFMTSCSRQPLLGFQSLAPLPCIQQIRLPVLNDNEAEKLAPLPTSSTCMNLLKLPNYRSKELLRKKLIDSIESGAGFELT